MDVHLVTGDITTQHVDAIVNAANSSLMGGGGVDGAIHRAAGPQLLAECRELRETMFPDGLPTGQAAATGAGNLPAKWVIHTVGPDARRGQSDPALLVSCFASCMATASKLGASSIAFPAISAGVFGWRADDVAQIAASVMVPFQTGDAEAGSVREVRFVLFDDVVLAAFRRSFPQG